MPLTPSMTVVAAMQYMEKVQLEALEALIQHWAWESPLEQLASSVLAPVLAHGAEKAFTEGQISRAVEEVLNTCADRGKVCSAVAQPGYQDVENEDELHSKAQEAACRAEKCGATQLAKVIHILARSSALTVSEVVGQILWQHRSAKILRLPRFRAVVEDVTWVESTAWADDSMMKTVTEVFEQITGSDGGLMKSRHWTRIVRMLEENPILKARLLRSDTDRLFYHYTHKPGPTGTVVMGLSATDLTKLLVELADTMSVHPAIVFLAIGSHVSHRSSSQEIVQ